MAYTPSIVGQYATRMGRPRNIWEALSNVSNLASVYFGEKQERDYMQGQDAQKRQFDIADTMSAFERQKQLIEFQNSMKPPKVEVTPEQRASEQIAYTKALSEGVSQLGDPGAGFYWDMSPQGYFKAPIPQPRQDGDNGGGKMGWTETVQRAASEYDVLPYTVAKQQAADNKTNAVKRHMGSAGSMIGSLIATNPDANKAIAKSLGLDPNVNADIVSQFATANPELFASRIAALADEQKKAGIAGKFGGTFDIRSFLESARAQSDSGVAASQSLIDAQLKNVSIPAGVYGDKQYTGYAVDKDQMYTSLGQQPQQAQQARVVAPVIDPAIEAEMLSNIKDKKYVEQYNSIKAQDPNDPRLVKRYNQYIRDTRGTK